MASDNLVTQWARASAVMVLTHFSWHIPASAPERLTQLHLHILACPGSPYDWHPGTLYTNDHRPPRLGFNDLGSMDWQKIWACRILLFKQSLVFPHKPSQKDGPGEYLLLSDCLAMWTIAMTSYEQHSISDHLQLHCLFISFAEANIKLNSKVVHWWPIVRENHWWPVDFSCNRPMMHNIFVCHGTTVMPNG